MPTQRTQRSARKLDRKKAVELADRGITNPEIAKIQGVASSTVYRFFSQSKPETEALQSFKKNRGDIFAKLSAKALSLQERIVDTFDESVITALKPSEKGSLIHQLGIAAAVHYDKERLERNLTTANVGILGKLIVAAEEKLGVPAKAVNETDSK